jgi:putative MATE family efflux protein
MQDDKSAFLGREAIFPLLLKMSVPAMVGMAVNALYNVVDTIFVGRGAGSLAIAGLTVAFPIQMIVGSFALMIGIGAASIISRRLGEKKKELAEDALGTALVSIAGAALILTFLLASFSTAILRLFGATDTILPYAASYLTTILWGVPFISFSMGGNNLIRAEGNAKVAMATMLIGMILNIILDPIFIFAFGLGIRGAALATVIAQGCSFVWILLYYLRRKSAVRLRWEKLNINWRQLREMVVLGIPNFVHAAGMNLIMLVINNTLGTLGGDLSISTFGMSMRLLSFAFMPIMGLAQGFQPIAGYNYGAHKYDRVKKALLMAFLVSVAMTLFCHALIMIFPKFLIGMFTTETALIELSAPALQTMALLIPIIGFQIVSSIYFQAVGKALPSLLLGLSRQFIVLLPMILILPRFLELNGVWAAFPASDLLSTIITLTALTFELRHLRKRHEEAPELVAVGEPE